MYCRSLLSCTLLYAAWPIAASEEVTPAALDADDACSTKECSLQLMQRKGSRESAEEEEDLDATWQGVRETGNKCMFSCSSSLGPTDCYHWRCVCKNDYIFSKSEKKCVSRYSEVGKTLIDPQDTGSTCQWKGCMEAATCNAKKQCMCIPGYAWKDGGCKVDTTTEAPLAKEGSTTFDPVFGVDEQEGTWEWPDIGKGAVSAPTAGEETIAEGSTPAASGGGSAACDTNPGCAPLKLSGDCCPAPNGVRLGCCT